MSPFEAYLAFTVVMGVISTPFAAVITRPSSQVGQEPGGQITSESSVERAAGVPDHDVAGKVPEREDHAGEQQLLTKGGENPAAHKGLQASGRTICSSARPAMLSRNAVPRMTSIGPGAVKRSQNALVAPISQRPIGVIASRVRMKIRM